ncbi:hypothetical protein FEZ34_01695 [Lacticaseibacillus casei]|nr:hypothetical protein FEZ34_01695 [Lacticaseibacillus casei]
MQIKVVHQVPNHLGKVLAVRFRRTSTYCLPVNGSIMLVIAQYPKRSYSWSIFLVLPARVGSDRMTPPRNTKGFSKDINGR